MEKIQLKRSAVVKLHNDMARYIDKVGRNANKLAWLCDHIITYEPNETIIEDHNKKIEKMQKELNRTIRRLSNHYARIHEEGEKKGTFITDDKGELTYTQSNQNKLNDEVDELQDKFDEKVQEFSKELIDFYIEKVSVVPADLPIEFYNALFILIPETKES